MAEMDQSGTQTLAGGSFYGSVQRKQELHEAIFTDLRHASARKLPEHAHELPFFGLLLEGSYGERYGRQQKQFCPFNIMFRPAGIPHQDEVGPQGLRFFEIEVRPSWGKRLEECSGGLDFACEDCHGGELLWLGMKLFRETREGCCDGELCVETLLAELLAAVGRLPREWNKTAPSWMERMVDRLRAEYCERLTLAELSREAGVHPVYLSRAFRKHVGEGIGEFVHRLRIRKACEQMLDREMALADISFMTGFADQSHFTRVFRRFAGTSPGAFRAQIAAGAS